jgi:hypothetical protein
VHYNNKKTWRIESENIMRGRKESDNTVNNTSLLHLTRAAPVASRSTNLSHPDYRALYTAPVAFLQTTVVHLLAVLWALRAAREMRLEDLCIVRQIGRSTTMLKIQLASFSNSSQVLLRTSYRILEPIVEMLLDLEDLLNRRLS